MCRLTSYNHIRLHGLHTRPDPRQIINIPAASSHSTLISSEYRQAAADSARSAELMLAEIQVYEEEEEDGE